MRKYRYILYNVENTIAHCVQLERGRDTENGKGNSL